MPPSPIHPNGHKSPATSSALRCAVIPCNFRGIAVVTQGEMGWKQLSIPCWHMFFFLVVRIFSKEVKHGKTDKRIIK